MNETIALQKKQFIKSLSGIRSLIEVIAESPTSIFWTFTAAHLILWTFVPAFVSANAPLDVIENYAWGHEWLMGTHKHPPMQAWWLEIFALLTGRAFWAHFFASQLAVVIAFWAVWDTGRRMLNKKTALIGVLLMEGIIYYNFTSPEFNANILQLPFWALTGRSFFLAVKKDHILDWLLLGVWSAAALYSKYSTLLLLVTLAVLIIAHKEGRRRLKSTGPYLALLTAAALFLPHFLWLIRNHFIPFDYASNQMHPLHHDLFLLAGLVGGQLLALLPAALLFFAIFDHRSPIREDRPHSFDKAFLWAITFGPFFLTFMLALVAGFKIRDMWATPFWNFVGLWAMFRFPPKVGKESTRRFVWGWSMVFTFTLLAYTGSILYGPYITQKTQRVHFPGQALADKMTDAWHARYHAPLKYVIGDIWPAGNVAYYAPERPHVLIMGDYKISPWIDKDELLKKGGIIVWCLRNCNGRGRHEDMPAFIHDAFPQAEIQHEFTLPPQTGADLEPVLMSWAIVPPADDDID